MSDDVSSVQLGGSRRLGGSELVVGPIAYGCWRFAGQESAAAHELIDTALDRGFTLIDTADIYGFDGSSGFGDAEATQVFDLQAINLAQPHGQPCC